MTPWNDRKTLLAALLVSGLSLAGALSLPLVRSESATGGGHGPGANPGEARLAHQQGPSKHSPEDRADARQRGMLQKLGLSPEQSRRVETLLQRGRAESQDLRRQLRERRQALMRYLSRPEATEAGARAQSSEIQALQNRLSEMRLKTWFAIRSQLTPEQIRKLGQPDKRNGSGR
jgi:Spy/CpxP family protein refolding chaperone